MSTAQKIIKNKIKRTLTLLTVLRLSPIAYKKEIQELEEKLERYRRKYMEVKAKELRGAMKCHIVSLAERKSI